MKMNVLKFLIILSFLGRSGANDEVKRFMMAEKRIMSFLKSDTNFEDFLTSYSKGFLINTKSQNYFGAHDLTFNADVHFRAKRATTTSFLSTVFAWRKLRHKKDSREQKNSKEVFSTVTVHQFWTMELLFSINQWRYNDVWKWKLALQYRGMLARFFRNCVINHFSVIIIE